MGGLHFFNFLGKTLLTRYSWWFLKYLFVNLLIATAHHRGPFQEEIRENGCTLVSNQILCLSDIVNLNIN